MTGPPPQLKVEAWFTHASGGAWADITQWVQSLTVTRGSTREQGPLITYEGGTSAMALDNRDARFTRENLAGPYVASGSTLVRPMVPLRGTVTRMGTTWPLFYHFAQSWDPGEYISPDYAVTMLSAADAFLILAGTDLATVGAVGANELSGARVDRILTDAGWYAGGGTASISAGQSAMQATTYGDNALALLQLTAASEIGELFAGEQGQLTFRDRHDPLTAARSATVQAVFGDRPGTAHAAGVELYYSAVSVPPDDLTVANDIQATRAGGTLQQFTDLISVDVHGFKRSYARTGLLLTSDSEALSWAQYVARITSAGSPEFDSITIIPAADPDYLWPQALGRRIGDRIQVWRRPPGMASSPISRDCFIRGIEHVVTAGEWTTTLTLQDAGKYSFLVLDNTVLGRLDFNALGY